MVIPHHPYGVLKNEHCRANQQSLQIFFTEKRQKKVRQKGKMSRTGRSGKSHRIWVTALSFFHITQSIVDGSNCLRTEIPVLA